MRWYNKIKTNGVGKMEDLDDLLEMALLGCLECQKCGKPIDPYEPECDCGWENPIRNLMP